MDTDFSIEPLWVQWSRVSEQNNQGQLFNQQMQTLLRATNEYPCKVKTKCSHSPHL